MEAFTVDMITKDIHGIMEKKIKVKKKHADTNIWELYEESSLLMAVGTSTPSSQFANFH